MLNIKKMLQAVMNKIRAPGNSLDESTESSLQHSHSIIHSKKQITMSMYNYGVGGNEVKVDANEAIQEIQENKTLLVSKLTDQTPIKPEITRGAKTIDEVFKHYKPSISVDHETEEGRTVTENFAFRNLADFTPKSLVENSPFLKNLNVEQEQYNNMIRELRNNKPFKNMLTDNHSKAAFIDVLKAVIHELENNHTN